MTMAVQLGKFAKKKNHWIVHLKCVNYMIYKIYLNKVNKRTKKESWPQSHLSSLYPLAGTMRLLAWFQGFRLQVQKGGKKKRELTPKKSYSNFKTTNVSYLPGDSQYI